MIQTTVHAVDNDRYALRHWKQDGLKQKSKGVLGTLLMFTFPARAAAMKRADFTHHGRRPSLLTRLIGAGIAYRALRKRDFDGLCECHKRFWGGVYAKAYHDDGLERFESVFLRYYTPVIDQLEQSLADASADRVFCEIGSGSGMLINYLSQRFKDAGRLIGIDLCPITTQATRAAFPYPKMEFVAGDALAYIREHAEPGWIYLTHNGVLEYFEPKRADAFFELVASLTPATLVLIEPVAANHDLETDPNSSPYGQEFAFSHNYPHLLEKHGFRIMYRHEEVVFGMRTMLLLAQIGS